MTEQAPKEPFFKKGLRALFPQYAPGTNNSYLFGARAEIDTAWGKLVGERGGGLKKKPTPNPQEAVWHINTAIELLENAIENIGTQNDFVPEEVIEARKLLKKSGVEHD